LAARLGLEGRVLFAGFRDDLPDLYAALDLFALASISGEGSPAVLKEAMAAGIPVVSSSPDGVEEIIEDARHGLLTPPGDAAAMAAGIPVVSSSLDGVEEIIEDARHGLLTPPGDAAAMARALERLSADAPLRARLAGAARGRAAEFSIDRMVRNTEAVYASLGARQDSRNPV